MIHRDDLPDTPEWCGDSRPCPIPCKYCAPTTSEAAGDEPHLVRGTE